MDLIVNPTDWFNLKFLLWNGQWFLEKQKPDLPEEPSTS